MKSQLEAATLLDTLNRAAAAGVTRRVPDQLRSMGVETLIFQQASDGEFRITSDDLRRSGMRAPSVAIEATIRVLRSTDLNAPSNVLLTVRPTTGTWLGVLYPALVCFGIAGYQLFQNQGKSGLLFLAFGCFAGGLQLLNTRSLINTAWPGLLAEARRLAEGSPYVPAA